MKLEIILPLLCWLLDLFTNKHCRAWSSMINLWIDSRTCQKYPILLSARQRSNKLFRAFKRKCFGEYDPERYPWSGFAKFIELILQKQAACPRKICIENWRKPPIFTAFLEIFLYLKNNDSVERVLRVLLIELFIYFQGKIRFLTVSGRCSEKTYFTLEINE